jgi:hypothetical protein
MLFGNLLRIVFFKLLLRNLDALLELMISSFPLKRYRLECLHHLIVYKNVVSVWTNVHFPKLFVYSRLYCLN